MVSLAWLWPMVHLSGGIAGYKAALMGLGARLWQGTSVFSATGLGGVARNAVRLTKYTAYGWNVMAIPPLLWIARKWRWKVQAITHGQFLGIWIAPPLLFYLLIHMGNPGLVFVYLPALMLASAGALVQLGDRMSKPRQWVAAAAFAAVLVASLQFLALPEHPFGPSDGRYLTRQAIEERDEFLEQAMATIRQDFPADSTIILATQWRHAAYYLPDYLIFGLPGPRIEGQEGSFGAVYINCGQEYSALRPPTEANRYVPESARHLVAFDERARQWGQDDCCWIKGDGKVGHLSYRELRRGEKLRFTLAGYEIVPATTRGEPIVLLPGGQGP